MIAELERAIKEALNLDVSLSIRNNSLIITGTDNSIEDLKAYVFIHGYLYGINNKNKKVKIYNPEAM